MSAGSDIQDFNNVWSTRVYDWIRRVYPHEQHMLLNSAIGAVTSAYFAPCITTMVPPDVDAVFMVNLVVILALSKANLPHRF